MSGLCGRCGDAIRQGWENDWPLHGTIDLGSPSQAFAKLRGRTGCADASDFEWWSKGHPAMEKNDAQRVTFKWDCKSSWRLCYDCQMELLALVGKFLGCDK